MLLGCIAGDLAGATDLAAMLVGHGMRTVVHRGLPRAPLPEADAAIISLPPGDAAAAEAVRACEALLAQDARQILLRQDEAFGGAGQNDIGAVADALLHRLRAGFALVCPGFPAKGITVYQGRLFLGTELRAGEAHLPRFLARQTEASVGLLPFALVEQGAAAIRAACAQLAERGRRYAVADTVTEAHLLALGEAAAAHPLLLGGTGIGMALPENFRRAGLLPEREDAGSLPPPRGLQAVLAGSCARATLGQIGMARQHVPTLELDLLATPDAAALVEEARHFAAAHLSAARPVVIATASSPERAAALRARLGEDGVERLAAGTMARLALMLREARVGRLLISGSGSAETALGALGIAALRAGWQADAGLPWMAAEDASMHVLPKPGDGGARDLFLRAFQD